MNIEDAINELRKYPPRYELEALLECPETGDWTSEVVGISNVPGSKIVSVELLTRLLPENRL